MNWHAPLHQDWTDFYCDSRSVDAGDQQGAVISPLLCDTLQPAISPIKWTRTESKDDEIHLQDIEQIEEDYLLLLKCLILFFGNYYMTPSSQLCFCITFYFRLKLLGSLSFWGLTIWGRGGLCSFSFYVTRDDFNKVFVCMSYLDL